MKKSTATFAYARSRKVAAWGCSFDSLTELKYAISILEEYDFMRSPVSIYYHPGTRQPASFIAKYHRRYTPDFLVRNRETGVAYLIEIKPRASQDDPMLVTRKQVAENFIRQKKFDWTFKTVFDDEIILSEEQLAAFEECHHLQTKSEINDWFQSYSQKFYPGRANCFGTGANHAWAEYILYGKHIPNLFTVKNSSDIRVSPSSSP